MPKFILKWFQEERIRAAHLGVVNDEGTRKRVAVICGHISTTKKWMRAKPDAMKCAHCCNLFESGKRLTFIMGDGREVEIMPAGPRQWS